MAVPSHISDANMTERGQSASQQCTSVISTTLQEIDHRLSDTRPQEYPSGGKSCTSPKQNNNKENLGEGVTNPHLVNSIQQPQDSNNETRQRIVIKWEEGDAANPFNWSMKRKIMITIIGIIVTTNSTMGSSLPSNAIPYISKSFNVTSNSEKVLPNSIYLIGYVFGPLAFAPISETYGRRLVTLGTFSAFTIATMGAALADSWVSLLIFRLIAGIGASAPISIVGGIFADIYETPIARGRAVATFLVTIGFGPLIAPIISGCVSPKLGWRWSFWIAFIIAGASFVTLLFLPETFGPKLLTDRAKKLRRNGSNQHIIGPLELKPHSWRQLFSPKFLLPISMLFTEVLVSVVCLYLALLYGIFYVYFAAYPIIFEEIYGMDTCISGAMLFPIAIGSCLAVGVSALYDWYFFRARALDKAWSRTEEAYRLSLPCLAAPVIPITIFWLGWTARRDVHWLLPFFSGLFYGLTTEFIFIGLLNYLGDAYVIYSASAFAASSCSRSMFGALLPLATTSMYSKLGVAWGMSIIGLASLFMAIVPFILMKYGRLLREKSKLCTRLQQERTQ